jgi:hypothetical protein
MNTNLSNLKECGYRVFIPEGFVITLFLAFQNEMCEPVTFFKYSPSLNTCISFDYEYVHVFCPCSAS